MASGFRVIFTDLATSTTANNTSGTTGARTITSQTAWTHGIPVKGARHVVFRIYSSTSSPSSMTAAINVGNGAMRDSVYAASSGAGYGAALGNANLNAVNAPNSIALGCGSTVSGFYHDFVQLAFSASATAYTITRIDAEVWYGVDADAFTKTTGQADYVMPPT
jgi:hypothetical protein